MDRSFLSDDLIIEASRNFVCVRLTTYENKSEHEFMASLYERSGRPVENTTFTILSPDTKKTYIRPTRSPDFAFNNPFHMAATLHDIAAEYKKQANVETANILPTSASVKIGLNIAASDKLPLVVAVGFDKAERKTLEEKLNKVAWHDSLIGRCTYSSTHDLKKELKSVGDLESKDSGYLVVQPGEFGISGKVISLVAKNRNDSDLLASLTSAIAKYERPKSVNHRAHISNGVKAGVFWETALPVTDRMEAQARSRTKQQIKRQK